MANSDILTYDSGLTGHDTSATGDNFFTGAINTGQISHDPYVTGFAFWVWVSVPTWLSNPEEFKALSQKNFLAFQGLSNLEMETEGVRGGFTANETHYAKQTGAKPTEFTLRYQIHSGSPLDRFYNEWYSGIRDPHTGIATYPKQFGLEYHSSNHTGVGLYVVTRPDANNFDAKNIEFATLITHMQPKRINMEHFNFEQGTNDFATGEMPFSGVMHFGQQVAQYAESYISDKVYNFITENSFSNINTYTGS